MCLSPQRAQRGGRTHRSQGAGRRDRGALSADSTHPRAASVLKNNVREMSKGFRGSRPECASARGLFNPALGLRPHGHASIPTGLCLPPRACVSTGRCFYPSLSASHTAAAPRHRRPQAFTHPLGGRLGVGVSVTEIHTSNYPPEAPASPKQEEGQSHQRWNPSHPGGGGHGALAHPRASPPSRRCPGRCRGPDDPCEGHGAPDSQGR